MTDRRPCRRCQRSIDALAGHCPFCNWDQSQTPPPPEEIAAAPPLAVQYTPPEELSIKKLVGIGTGIVVMLVFAFLVGMVINRDGAPDAAPETVEQQAAEHNAENLKQKRADTPLVPAGEGGIDQQPITSAPVPVPPGQTPNDYARTDATAVSAEEYAEIARRAQAEKKKKMAVLVDPRSITGPAYAQAARQRPQRRRTLAPPVEGTPPVPSAPLGGVAAPPMGDAPQEVQRERSEPVRRAAVRTRPVPQYQPLPPIRGRGTARFTLTVGPDGRVKDISVEQILAGGNTPALVGAIQKWRFKPATENGEPVSAPYSVEISFGRE